MIVPLYQLIRSNFTFPGGDIVFKLLILFLLLRLYQWYTQYQCKCKRLMFGKTVVITGANSGIGKETARELARRGARVILACRNVKEGELAKDEIAAETANCFLEVLELDVSDLGSVRRFAGHLNRTLDCLDVLIHNAGVALMKPETTKDGLELTMATNHYGPFLLSHLLIDLMKRAEQGRVIVITSSLYRLGCLFDLNNPNPVEDYFPPLLYYISKYANIYFTLELARRLKSTEITVNCVHPGLVDTGIARNVPEKYSNYLKVFNYLFASSAEVGARNVVHMAVSDRLRIVTGKYFSGMKLHGLTKGVSNPEHAKRFWHISERLVNLRREDPRL